MWSAVWRSHDLPTPAATCPTSPRQQSFHQTGGAWGCFLVLARVPGVTVTTQLRLLEQKSRALMACVTNEESGHGSGLRLGWISGQEPATSFSCFLCQGILFRLVLCRWDRQLPKAPDSEPVWVSLKGLSWTPGTSLNPGVE